MNTFTKSQLIAAMKDLDDDSPVSVYVIKETTKGSDSGEVLEIKGINVACNGAFGQIEVLDL